jgi:hypothetical protein
MTKDYTSEDIINRVVNHVKVTMKDVVKRMENLDMTDIDFTFKVSCIEDDNGYVEYYLDGERQFSVTSGRLK